MPPLLRFCKVLLAAVGFLCAAASSSARAATYSYRPIVIPGASLVLVQAITDGGLAVGVFQTRVNGVTVSYGFTDLNGVQTVISPPGARTVVVTAVGNDGSVYGYYEQRDQIITIDFRFRDGVLTTQATPGRFVFIRAVSHDGTRLVATSRLYPSPQNAPQTVLLAHNGVVTGIGLNHQAVQPQAINNLGTVAAATELPGTGLPGTGLQRTVLFRDGAAVLLPGSLNSNVVPVAINDADTVLGAIFNVASEESYVDANGVSQTIRYPGARFTDLQAINNAGTVTGSATQPDGARSAFTWRNGVFAAVAPPPGTSSIYALPSINRAGQIAINAVQSGTNADISFVATPD